MALTDNKVSIKNIIARVYQNLGLSEEIDIGLIMEWTADVLDKINVYQQLKDQPGTINICDHKGELPCDFIYLTSISYNGKAIVKTIDTNSRSETNYPYYNTPTSYNEPRAMNMTYLAGELYKFNDKDNFLIENGYIKTSFCDGCLDITYTSLYTDDDGFPLIPDDISFKEAIFWYIAARYFYIKSISDDKFRWFYQDADQKYRYYVNQAGANAMMPDLFTLENIKRNFLRLVPKINSYDNFFTDLNNN